MTGKQRLAYEKLVDDFQLQFPGKNRQWVIFKMADLGITPETTVSDDIESLTLKIKKVCPTLTLRQSRYRAVLLQKSL